jgi:curved DNA-binding protein CbpA
MLTHYLVLGVDLEADDEEIRRQYLRQVKRYSPEKHPERFQKITDAYEAIKDRRSRVRGRIFGALSAQDYEGAIMDLARAREPKRRRPSLSELFEVQKTV